jgi:hypothetical protein
VRTSTGPSSRTWRCSGFHSTAREARGPAQQTPLSMLALAKIFSRSARGAELLTLFDCAPG